MLDYILEMLGLYEFCDNFLNESFKNAANSSKALL